MFWRLREFFHGWLGKDSAFLSRLLGQIGIISSGSAVEENEAQALRCRILFICAHNSARSQMAEGLLRQLAADRFEAYSAGAEATRIRPLAVRVMDEVGIDISAYRSKSLDALPRRTFDIVVVVCDDPLVVGPNFPSYLEWLDWSLPDPARVAGLEQDQVAAYRRIRDDLRHRIEVDLLALRN